MEHDKLLGLKKHATERQIVCIDAVIEHGTQGKAAIALGITRRTIERSLKCARDRASRQGWSPDHDMVHSAPDTHVVKGVSTFYDELGVPIRQWVKTDLKKENQELALQTFADGLTADLSHYVPKPRVIDDSAVEERLACVMIGDGHLGMMVQKDYGGGEWNLDIAESATIEAIEKLVRSCGRGTKIMLLNVGDFLHANTPGVTAAGTPLDTSGHYVDSVEAAVRVYRQAVDMMLEFNDEVILMNTRGNHDSDVSMVINVMLKVFYESEPRVVVLDNTSKFQLYIYYNVFIASHHGDKGIKPQRLYEYYTRTQPVAWGETVHRYCHMGHIHHKQASEVGGAMLFESWNTLACADEWHAQSGYGSSRSMSAVIYSPKWGEVQRHKLNFGQLEVA